MKPVTPGSAFTADILSPQLRAQLGKVMAGTELKEIEQAVQGTTAEQPLYAHFSKALELLSSPHHPNYREAVLEAIAAVDYVLGQYSPQRINDDTLLSMTANPNSLFSIRHVLTETGIALSFEKARYWLITCAALINHFKTIAG